MTRPGAEPEVRLFDSSAYQEKKWSLLERVRDGARSSALVRLNWLTLEMDPEDIPWAEPNGNDLRYNGRAAVLRASWAAIAATGRLDTEFGQVAVREWDGQVQMSNGVAPNLFDWGDDNTFTAAVFAESDEGRVAMGVRNGSHLAIPEGLVLIDRLPPKEMARDYPGVWLAG